MFLQIISVFILLFQSSIANNNYSNENYELVKKGLVEYFKTKTAPDYLLKTVKTYKLPEVFREDMEDRYREIEDQICGLCRLVGDVVVAEHLLGTANEILGDEVIFLCTLLGIENERVCAGVVDLNLDIFVAIIDGKANTTSSRFCATIFQSLNCQTDDGFEWEIEIPGGNSADRPELDTPGENAFNVLHISDFHYDPMYLPNGNADCGEPICCQNDQEPASSPENSCGYWTDYRQADAPWHLVEETVRQAKSHDFSYVYYTGDIISHRVWSTSRQANTESITKIFEYLKDNYDVPVYPVFGNHEPNPLNVWIPEKDNDVLNTQWVLDLAAELWSPWLGESTKETIRKGGYYTISPKPGFRIVGLNGNVCYNVNWWLVYDDVDPYDQLDWLVGVLQKAEEAGESVHILTHVPPGQSSTLSVCSREFRKIVERFANTITGQFNGHTHKDEFHIYYNSSETTQAIAVAFNGASVTPYSLSNPSYKLYQIDDKAFTVLDYEEWTFNLTQANANASTETTPEWYQLYTFKTTYGVQNLQASEVGKVPYKMAENHTLLQLYNAFHYRRGDAGLELGCDEDCEKKHLCSITSTHPADQTQCDFFQQLYDNNGQH